MKTETVVRAGVTIAVVALAVSLAVTFWNTSTTTPWTRDGRIRAEIIRVAPDVSGLVSAVDVEDNQMVLPGQILFRVDPVRYELALEEAASNLAAAEAAAQAAGASVQAAEAKITASRADYNKYEAQSVRRQHAGDVVSAESRSDAAANAVAAKASVGEARANRAVSTAGQAKAIAAVRQAQSAVNQAKLDLERSQIRAAVRGHVTNLDVHVGDYVTKGTPRMAVVASDKVWVYGYFEETKLPFIRPGAAAEVKLMGGGRTLRGTVEGIARGITDQDNSPGSTSLLANVNPTFNWIRLAQRVPVKIRIDRASIPPDMVLASGMTASVYVQQ